MNTKLNSLIKFLLTVDKSAAESVYLLKVATDPFDAPPIPGSIFDDFDPRFGKPDRYVKEKYRDFEIPNKLYNPNPTEVRTTKPKEEPIGYLPGEVMSGRAEKIFNILKDKYQKGDQIDTGEEQGLFDPTSINQKDEAGKEFSVPGKLTLDTEISAEVVDDNGNKKLILGPA